jgi:hypothetical protein
MYLRVAGVLLSLSLLSSCKTWEGFRSIRGSEPAPVLAEQPVLHEELSVQEPIEPNPEVHQPGEQEVLPEVVEADVAGVVVEDSAVVPEPVQEELPPAVVEAPVELPSEPEAAVLPDNGDPDSLPMSEEADEVADEVIEAPESSDPIVTLPRERVTMGWVEWACFQPETVQLKAKIDTGARTCSLHASNLVEFERDGKSWVRFEVYHQKTGKPIVLERKVQRYLHVVQHEDQPQRRPVVEMELKIGPFHEKKEFTLVDRSNFVYQVLIGRNLIKGLAYVDVEETFLLGRPCPKNK